jgi:hypothetical protein
VSVSTNNLAILSRSATVVVAAAVAADVNVVGWGGVSVSASFAMRANVDQWASVTVSASNLSGSVNVATWAGITTSGSDLAIQPSLLIDANIVSWRGTTVSASNMAISNAMVTPMTESYAADAAEFTIPQALYQIWAYLGEFSISDKSYVSYKLDGATPAMQHSLDSGATPHGIHRKV